jgi:glycosyltransferase involved in cell wall biosynthesis
MGVRATVEGSPLDAAPDGRLPVRSLEQGVAGGGMKLLFSFQFPFRRFQYGGGHQHVRGLARELARAGHDVHVCCMGSDELGVESQDAPVRYHFGGEYSRWSRFLLAARTLRLARELRPDWICCMTSEAALVVPICNRLGIPVMVYVGMPELSRFPLSERSTYRQIRYQLDLFMLYLGSRTATKVLTVGNHTRLQAHQNWRIERERLATVAVGLESSFLEAPAPLPGPLPPAGPRFISICRIVLAEKPLDRVAEALSKLPLQWDRWTIVGSGVDEIALRAKIASLGLVDRVHFVGMKTSSEIARLIAEHEIVLLPSVRESFFITAYEAAACGRVIVTNDVAEISDYFAAEPSVIIADDDSSAAYLESVRHAIEDYAKLQESACETSQRVRRDFTWSAIAEEFVSTLS